jgi:hypothetical protein
MGENEAISVNSFKDTAAYQGFRKGFLAKPGVHLLGVGMTGAGKTMKALVLAKWCLDEGKAVVWFDTRKPDDLDYLFHFAKKATIFYPTGCMINITGEDLDLTFKEIKNPSSLFREIQPGLNIVSLRPFFDDSPPYVNYLAKVMHGLINDAFRKKIRTGPIQIFCDEFQEICPSRRIQHTGSQQRLGARIAMALFQLRSAGIGFCAFIQSYGNILTATRMQFSYYLICKDPDGDYGDYIGKILIRYEKFFTKFNPSQSVIIPPRGRFGDIIEWPMPIKAPKITVDYEGIFSEQETDSIVMRVPRGLAGQVKALINTPPISPAPSPPHPESPG